MKRFLNFETECVSQYLFAFVTYSKLVVLLCITIAFLSRWHCWQYHSLLIAITKHQRLTSMWNVKWSTDRMHWYTDVQMRFLTLLCLAPYTFLLTLPNPTINATIFSDLLIPFLWKWVTTSFLIVNSTIWYMDRRLTKGTLQQNMKVMHSLKILSM